jgi:hypothetical protein
MKKHLLLTLLISTSFMLKSLAQNTFEIYTDANNRLSYVWDNYVTSHGQVTTNSPAEGTNHYEIQYNSTGGTWGGAIYFNFDGWSGNGIDFTPYTHLVISWKGTADIVYNTLNVGFQDVTYGESEFAIAGANSNTSSYQQTVISLSSISGGSSDIDWTKVAYLYFTMCCNNAIGTWYIDNIYVTDSPPTSIAKKYLPVNATVGPNPSSGIYKINSEDQIDEVIVTDYIGNQILTSKETTIDLSSYPDGLYFLTIIAGEKKAVEKLVKQ